MAEYGYPAVLQDAMGPVCSTHPAAEAVSSVANSGDSFPMAFAQLMPSQAAAVLGPTLAALPAPDQLALGGISALLGVLYVLKVQQ